MKKISVLNFPLCNDEGEMTDYSVIVSIDEEKLIKLQNEVWANSMEFFNEVVSQSYRALNMDLFDDHEDFYVEQVYSIISDPEFPYGKMMGMKIDNMLNLTPTK